MISVILYMKVRLLRESLTFKYSEILNVNTRLCCYTIRKSSLKNKTINAIIVAKHIFIVGVAI